MRIAAALTIAVALIGCGGRGRVADVVPAAERAADWHRVATSADRLRLRNWRTTWLAAVEAARKTDPASVAREGHLFEPDHALSNPIPPVGSYRCRIVKLGAKPGRSEAFTAYPWSPCSITGDDGAVAFSKHEGAQRPVGLIFPDGANRAVFLGALMLGDESRALAYGRDVNRDMAGLVDRVGPRRWRIAFPEPRFESQLDVIELVPVG